MSMRLIFFGTSGFASGAPGEKRALPVLDALARGNFDIVAVVTQPDRPVGRDQHLEAPPVKVRAQELGLPVLQPETIKGAELPSSELGVVAAYGKIIPKEILDHFPKGVLNVHPSLLPKYRGPTPIQTAIAKGDSQTGVSIILLDEEMDHGPILAQEVVKILPEETTPALETRLAEVGADLLVRTMPKWRAGEITPQPQDHASATYTKMLTRDDGRINWSESAEVIARKLRAFTPWPGIWTQWKGTRVKILAALSSHFHTLEHGSALPGAVVRGKDALEIICGSGTLAITALQPEGGRPMTAEEFLRGHAEIAEDMLA